MRPALLPALAALGLLLPATAIAGTIGMTVDKTELSIGEVATVVIEVRGGSASRPTISAPAGLELVQAGGGKKQEVVRGRLQITHRYTFTLTGTQVGTYTFGPARAEIDGQAKASATYTIEVTEGGGGRSRSSSSSSSRRSRGTDASVGAASPGKRGGDYYAIANVSDDRPYVGESLTYEVEIGSFLRTLGGINWEQPSFAPLSAEPGVKPLQDERQEILDGRRYTVNTISIPLFAIEDASVDIEPAEFTMTVARRGTGLIARGQEVEFASNGVRVRVRPLPAKGRPDDFAGAVGRFRLEASLDETSIETGGTTTLTVRVRGAGSLRGQELAIELPDSIRVYDEEPDVRTGLTSDGLMSEVTYRKALVPLEPGQFDIGRVQLSYFNPDAGRYETTRSDPVRLVVSGEPVVDAAVVARSSSLTAAKEQVEVLGADILPLHAGARMLGDGRIRLTSPLVLALLVLPLLGFGGLATRAGGRRLAGTEGGRRRARGKAAKAARSDADRAAKHDDVAAAEDALRAYLTARLERSGAALSGSDAPAVVTAAGAPPDLADHLGRLLHQSEARRYGGGSGAGLADAIADWIRDADRSWR